MVKDNNCMNSLQEEYLPVCIDSGTGLLYSDMALPRFAEPNISSLRRERAHEDHPLLKSVFSCGLCGVAASNSLPLSSQKKLLTCYQCGTQTRLMHSLVCPSITATKVTSHFGLHKDEEAAKVDHTHQVKSFLHDESADNYECVDGSEMHEDTKEIDALLYFDDDNDGYSEEDDEVRSTGHSPLVNIGIYGKQHQFEEFTEVPSFKFPNKMQILPNMANLENFDKHEQCEGITGEVSCLNGPAKRQKLIKTRGDEMGFISSDKQARKESLHETLKLLESIVPETKGKDPLAVLDDAIDYLNHMKIKATSLGVDSHLE